jgi:ATP-dependent exoDNAse (exonuclease V) beta subunit
VSELCRHLDPLLERRRKKNNLSIEMTRLPSIDADGLLKEQGLESAFGTLTHQLLDRWGRDPAGSPPEPDWSRSGIPPEFRQRLLAGAVNLCRSFFDSELGIRSGQAERADRELPFLYLFEDAKGPLYISGQIDLCFEWRDRLYLVDFKTDSSYRPGEHEAQLGLYRMALREQTDKEIRAVLFLLRSGEEAASDESLELGKLISEARHLLT